MTSHSTPPVRSLTDWLQTNYRFCRVISDATAATYQAAIWTVERETGQELTSANVSGDLVNLALVRLLRAGRSPHYVRTVKSCVAAIWVDMADCGAGPPVDRLRTIRSSRPQHVIWFPGDVAALICAARALVGPFRKTATDRSGYWESLIRVAWDTALRRVDLHRLRGDQLKAEMVILQNKTQKPVICLLRRQTLDMARQWSGGRNGPLWPLWGTDEAFRRAFGRIVASAGIEVAPFKTIRKSAGTAAEIVQPGAGHLLLGNSRAIFERHYLDATRIQPPQPPELKG